MASRMMFSDIRGPADAGSLVSNTNVAISSYQFSAPVRAMGQQQPLGSSFKGVMGAQQVVAESELTRLDSISSQRGEVSIPLRAPVRQQTSTSALTPQYKFK